MLYRDLLFCAVTSNSSDSNDIQILIKKIKETDNWKKQKAFEEVSNEGQGTISVRQVVTNNNNVWKCE